MHPPTIIVVHELVGFQIHAPADAPTSRDAPRKQGSGRLPYWSKPWPSGVALARLVVGELADRVRGKRVIELGCGLGITGMAAARLGADVTLTDGDAEALALAAENAKRNELTLAVEALEFETVPGSMIGKFDVVLGADIVYDRAQIAPLATAIRTLLAPGGEAWVAEPHRLGPSTLLEAAAAAGLDARLEKTLPHPDGMFTRDSEDVMDIFIYRLALRA